MAGNITKEEIIAKLKENKDICPIKNINGYTVRTIFSANHMDGEVIVSVIVVYDSHECNKVLQVSVDAENLFGTLLATKPFSLKCDASDFSNQDFNKIADQVISYLH